MRKKTSLKDIAKKVGVSTALVSYVLNNQKTGRISKEISLKIKEAAKELNYRTNQIARSLKTNKTMTIGLIVADISNPFFSGLARIIEDEADKNNYTVIFGSADENVEKSSKLINALVDRQVDGLIISPAANTYKQLQYLEDNDIPFVLIDRYFPEYTTNYVTLDNYKAAYTAVQHLIDGGNKRIAFVTFETQLFNLQERQRGYLAALEENNIPFDAGYVKKILPADVKTNVEKVLGELFEKNDKVDAILFVSNTLATYGLKYIHSRGIKIPDEIAIICFDETEASDLFYAPLSYMKQPLPEMGAMATKILLNKICGKTGKNDIIQLQLEAELVIRKSTLRDNQIG